MRYRQPRPKIYDIFVSRCFISLSVRPLRGSAPVEDKNRDGRISIRTKGDLTPSGQTTTQMDVLPVTGFLCSLLDSLPSVYISAHCCNAVLGHHPATRESRAHQPSQIGRAYGKALACACLYRRQRRKRLSKHTVPGKWPGTSETLNLLRSPLDHHGFGGTQPRRRANLEFPTTPVIGLSSSDRGDYVRSSPERTQQLIAD